MTALRSPRLFLRQLIASAFLGLAAWTATHDAAVGFYVATGILWLTSTWESRP